MSINAISSSGVGSNLMNKGNVSPNVQGAGKNESMEKTLEKKPISNENKDLIQKEEKKFSKEDATELIEQANKAFKTFDRRFEYSVHEKTKQVMVKVIDVNNDEVIRELPSEKILDMVASMWEVAGIMIDTKA